MTAIKIYREIKTAAFEQAASSPVHLWVLLGEPLADGGYEVFRKEDEAEYDYFLNPEKYADIVSADMTVTPDWWQVDVMKIDYVTEKLARVILANGHTANLRLCKVEAAYPDPKRTYRKIPAAVYRASGVTLL